MITSNEDKVKDLLASPPKPATRKDRARKVLEEGGAHMGNVMNEIVEICSPPTPEDVDIFAAAMLAKPDFAWCLVDRLVTESVENTQLACHVAFQGVLVGINGLSNATVKVEVSVGAFIARCVTLSPRGAYHASVSTTTGSLIATYIAGAEMSPNRRHGVAVAFRDIFEWTCSYPARVKVQFVETSWSELGWEIWKNLIHKSASHLAAQPLASALAHLWFCYTKPRLSSKNSREEVFAKTCGLAG